VGLQSQPGMDLRCAIGEYVNQGRELLTRLRSPEEGPTATPVDLHILRVQLFLLDLEATNMQRLLEKRDTPPEAENVKRKKPPPAPT